MWVIWLLVGAVLSPLVIWYFQGRQRGRILRVLNEQGMMNAEELQVFIRLRKLSEKCLGRELGQHEYDALAMAVAGQPAGWATGVIDGRIGPEEAMNDVDRFIQRCADPNDPGNIAWDNIVKEQWDR